MGRRSRPHGAREPIAVARTPYIRRIQIQTVRNRLPPPEAPAITKVRGSVITGVPLLTPNNSAAGNPTALTPHHCSWGRVRPTAASLHLVQDGRRL
jgi:hypothetical protein